MEILIRIFDILASIGIIVSLNLVTKFNRAWLLYVIACVLQIAVCGYNRIPGMTIMGIILFFTGIRNYRKGN